MIDIARLNTARCVLSRIEADDMQRLTEIFADFQTRAFLPELCEMLDSTKGVAEMVASFHTLSCNGEGILWGVRCGAELIGFVAVMDISDRPILLYAMHPDYRMRGLMKESVAAVLDYVARVGIVKTIHTEVYKDNCASVKMLCILDFVVTEEDNEKVHLSKDLATNFGRW
jgi:RimJ/RimL family protein N-acetyltransferase